jgi:hypothetical protein
VFKPRLIYKSPPLSIPHPFSRSSWNSFRLERLAPTAPSRFNGFSYFRFYVIFPLAMRKLSRF